MITIKNYSTKFDNITEYSYISEKSMTIEEFEKVLAENNISLTGGWLTFSKKQLNFKSGKKEYKHIVKYEYSKN